MSTSTPSEPEPLVDGYVSIALPVPLRRAFTYRVAEGMPLQRGMRVLVPFSGRKLPGIVLGAAEAPPPEVKRVLRVSGLLDPTPVFPAELLRFLLDAADYYLHPVGEVLRAAAPALPKDAIKALRQQGALDDGRELSGLQLATRRTWRLRPTEVREPPGRLGSKQRQLWAKVVDAGSLLLSELRDFKQPRPVARALRDKGLIEIEECELVTDPFFASQVERDTAPEPNAEQRLAIDTLTRALDEPQPRGVLLHGVTGSGKTEVYLHLVGEALERGRGALVLVPEIALTPQLVGRFRARFGEGIAVLHSGLSDRQRYEAWQGLRRGRLRLAIGARSALFAPVPDLGVIVVDEEHDPSFKQEEGFRYQGRDMALLRAARAGAVCVLGSATPSLESRFLAEREKLGYLVLRERARAQALPKVELVDLARHPGDGPIGHPLITAPLHTALRETLAAKQQAILFLNRRGFSPTLRCPVCTQIASCPACSVSLTEHRRAGVLRCHYCDFTTPRVDECPSCHARELTPLGIGTERVQDALAEAFPEARVGRLDRDTAMGAGVEEVLDRMRRRELDVLVGTQMVTKGHDLPGVTLVGVLLADQGLAFPDFRAAERTFQLLAQVAGRAGRGDEAGRVVLQTHQPAHPSVRFALRHDYEGFYRAELSARQELGYAPFARLCAVRFDAGDEHVVRKVGQELLRVARSTAPVAEGAVTVLGPAPAPIARLRGRYRARLLMRAASRPALRQVALALAQRIEAGIAPARAHVDIDPVSML